MAWGTDERVTSQHEVLSTLVSEGRPMHAMFTACTQATEICMDLCSTASKTKLWTLGLFRLEIKAAAALVAAVDHSPFLSPACIAS